MCNFCGRSRYLFFYLLLFCHCVRIDAVAAVAEHLFVRLFLVFIRIVVLDVGIEFVRRVDAVGLVDAQHDRVQFAARCLQPIGEFVVHPAQLVLVANHVAVGSQFVVETRSKLCIVGVIVACFQFDKHVAILLDIVADQIGARRYLMHPSVVPKWHLSTAQQPTSLIKILYKPTSVDVHCWCVEWLSGGEQLCFQINQSTRLGARRIGFACRVAMRFVDWTRYVAHFVCLGRLDKMIVERPSKKIGQVGKQTARIFIFSLNYLKQSNMKKDFLLIPLRLLL